MKLRDKRLTISCLLLFLCLPVRSQSPTESKKYDFWEHLYMPLEMGYAISTTPGQEPAYLVNTGIEYRFGREKGWFIAGDYDEHTHVYKNLDAQKTTIVEGDIRYTDFVIGPGWRQPLFKKISGTVMLQTGATASTIKHLNYVDNQDHYHLSDKRIAIPTAKLRIGLEYVFDSSFNLFIQANYTQHLQETQLEDHGAKGVFGISAGFNVNLF